MFITITTPSCAFELIRHFWLHEHGFPVKLSDEAIDSLDALGVEYKTEWIDGELDLTECVRDVFQKPHQKLFLDFMTHTKMGRYSPAISQLCIEYLTSAAIGKPKQYIIRYSDVFIVFKNQ